MTPGKFVPDRDPNFYLLARHRQPLAANVAQAYIEALTKPGDLVVDPFAASPATLRAAIECGRRAIGVESNPLVAFAARFQVARPAPREIENALARWGEVRRETELVHTHVEAQYASVCASCGGAVTVDYFIWARELHAPVEKVYSCAKCGPRRDPASEADRNRAALTKPRGFHYHLLLERLGAIESPHYNLLRELLDFYTPRNLYALVTLTLKLDAEIKDEAAREILSACLLHALDLGTTLYSAPDALPERQTPEIFIEMNIWRVLEAAAHGLASAPPGLSLAQSPADVVNTPTPQLYLGHGSAHALAGSLDAQAALVLASPARLDPTFWQLSYLWSRWILGKTVSHSLEPFLDKSRQRWGWYGSALAAAWRDAAQLLRGGGHAVVCFPAGSHAMIEALSAAAAPVFQLESLIFRPHRGAAGTSEFGAVRGDYRVVWSRREQVSGDGEVPPQSAAQVAVKIRRGALFGATEILAARAEPLAYSWVHHQALAQLAREGTLAETLTAKVPVRDNAFQFLRREMEAGLKEGYARDLDHWKEDKRVLWLRRQPPREGAPLSERVEQAVREALSEAPEISKEELEDRILARFTELLTPEPELVDLCAVAYADEREGVWHRRETDVEAELERAKELLARLGALLNFAVGAENEQFDLTWRDEKIVPASSSRSVPELRVHEDSHGFILRPRVDFRMLLRTPASPLRGFVVIPEVQVGLTKEKLRRLPVWVKPLREAGWEFLRIPLIELLLASPAPARSEFQLALGLEPPLEKGKEQMELF